MYNVYINNIKQNLLPYPATYGRKKTKKIYYYSEIQSNSIFEMFVLRVVISDIMSIFIVNGLLRMKMFSYYIIAYFQSIFYSI